ILAIAAPIFVAALIIFFSAVLDKLLLDREMVISLRYPDSQIGSANWWEIIIWLLVGLVIVIAIAWLPSRNVNINRFSLHAVYRNRLVRAFLGASRPVRQPDHFSGFDLGDNPLMYQLWPPPTGAWPEPKRADWRPFHVVNMALNVVSTKRLSWQGRKPRPLPVSAPPSGSACAAHPRPARLRGPE